LRLFHFRDGLAVDQSDLAAADQPGATPSSTTQTGAGATANKKQGAKAKAVDKPDKDDEPTAVETTHQAKLLADAGGAGMAATTQPSTSTTAPPTGAGANPAALKASLDAVDAAVDPSHFAIGQLDVGSYDRTVNLLLTGAPEPILKGAPVDAVSNLVWQRLHQDGGLAKP
jgi:hypothetical protein